MPKMQRSRRYCLKDSPFFRLRSRKKLANLLRISPQTLKAILSRNDLYLRCWKHKKLEQWLHLPPSPELAELYRPIDIPDPRLKAVQSRIAELFGRIEPPEFLFSPVKGRSYVENAARHTAGTAFWLLDVEDYFPSCTANNVARLFVQDFECSKDVAAILIRLVTHSGCLPQGAPCSPILAYYSNRHMWLEISDRVSVAGCTLSLYADDITISGPVVRKELIWQIKKIIHSHGLRLKLSKEVSLIKVPADITGVIVKNGKTHLPNRQLKRLAELRKERALTGDPEVRSKIDSQISGRIAQRKQVEQSRNIG